MEILARDLLKIDRKGKSLREMIKALAPRDEAFFSDVEKFVNKYVWMPGGGRATYSTVLTVLLHYFSAQTNRYEEDLVYLHKATKETQELYSELMKKFGENPTTDSEEVFGYLSKFAKSFMEARERLEAEENKGDKKKETVRAVGRGLVCGAFGAII